MDSKTTGVVQLACMNVLKRSSSRRRTRPGDQRALILFEVNLAPAGIAMLEQCLTRRRLPCRSFGLYRLDSPHSPAPWAA